MIVEASATSLEPVPATGPAEEQLTTRKGEKPMADHLATKTHPTVSPEEWQAARDELLAEEKEHTVTATSSRASDVSFPG